jgi:DnaK suppressor protein
MMTEEEREQFRAKLTAMQDEIRAISDSAAQDLKPVTLDQTSVGRVSRVGAMQLQQMSQETARRANNSWSKLKGHCAASNQSALACAFCAEWRSAFAA